MKEVNTSSGPWNGDYGHGDVLFAALICFLGWGRAVGGHSRSYLSLFFRKEMADYWDIPFLF